MRSKQDCESHPSFDEALAAPGPKVLAWRATARAPGERTLSIFSLAGGGAEQVAWRRHPEGEVSRVSDALRTAGHVVGDYEDGSDFVWAWDDGALSAWDGREQALATRGEELRLADGRVYRRGDLTLFFAYASDDYLDRGVRAQLRSGEVVEIVDHQAWSALSDPTYSRNELLYDTTWAAILARELAAWAGTGYQSRI